MKENNSISILLADDHSLIRQGLVFLLEEIEEEYALHFEIDQASNIAQIQQMQESKAYDFAIIDAHFPDGNSLSLLPEMKSKHPEIKILIFTGIEEETYALKYLNAGAHGFLSKLSEEKEIKKAILQLYHEGEYISPTVQTLLIQSFKNKSLINPLLKLSERELEVAHLYAKGFGNLEIANHLDLKQNTVSTMKKRIFDKLEISNIVELIEIINQHS